MAALQGDDPPSAEMVAGYERRRDFIYEAVNQIPGCSCQKPDSAFYMFVNIKKTGMTSDEFCKYILKECYVTMTPGTAFGNSGEGYVRISYANSLEKLREAARRMMEVLKKVMKYGISKKVERQGICVHCLSFLLITQCPSLWFEYPF